MSNPPETTDWLSTAEQKSWFDRFMCRKSGGLRFQQFQAFLKAAIYTYFSSYERAEEFKFSYQQEMLLFQNFDSKNDHLIDFEEFSHLCRDWLVKTYHRSSALVIVDVQNDFIDGSLALINGPAGQDGAEVVPVINGLLEKCNFDTVVYTQDWHPADHIGFHTNLHLRKYTLKEDASQNFVNALESVDSDGSCSPDEQFCNKMGTLDGKGSKFKPKKLMSNVHVFDTVLFDDGRMEQKLWPAHCVQDTWGAELHPKLRVLPNAIKIQKGTLSHVDAYSAFWDNMRLNETGLRQELTSRKIDDVFFCGLALDYCVAASALDSVNAGFTTFVIEDACRGIDNDEMELRKREMVEKGILMVNSDVVWSRLMNIYGSNQVLNQGTARNGRQVNNHKVTSSEEKYCENLSIADGKNVADNRLLLDICFNRALALGSI